MAGRKNSPCSSGKTRQVVLDCGQLLFQKLHARRCLTPTSHARRPPAESPPDEPGVALHRKSFRKLSKRDEICSDETLPCLKRPPVYERWSFIEQSIPVCERKRKEVRVCNESVHVMQKHNQKKALKSDEATGHNRKVNRRLDSSAPAPVNPDRCAARDAARSLLISSCGRLPDFSKSYQPPPPFRGSVSLVSSPTAKPSFRPLNGMHEAICARHNSFRRHLPRQMNVTSFDFSMDTVPLRQSSTVSIGRIKPELYKQKSVDSEGEAKEPVETCGKLSFALRYDYEEQALVVRILKALELPAKDFTGTSDPYVKIYLLPERKKKFQTRVHRKNLNPMFDETFCFPVVYDELCNRKLHFSVYDFDRFTSHDMIGEVVVDNLFELSDLSREAVVWKDIHAATTESVDLGEIMYSLCYLPTAGRMTLTVIKCRNLKAMDITGSSDPYVKVYLICDGRRLKKRKTTTKKSTLNPVYSEAIIFDIPPENVEQVSLSIMVMDYDRVGHNEVIGVCYAGPDAEGLGRDHWNEMLAYPRKPITHWHALGESPGRAASFESQGSCPSPKPPQTP
ncbi:putative synaptotagmin-10-like [Scophthalmus maximus]|uniref:Putative synaptotagmin-10-like n=1 Tax=Scophthalmus maximus TaxID=52904 RepID=A0A2U9B2X1_SCOMX|nr:putative synaptotagmin-10-like [Scophthalmus maximus]